MKQSEKIHSQIDVYIEEVRHELYSLVPSEAFLKALRETLAEYADLNPECTLDDLVEQFGTPEMVAKEFLGDTKELSPSRLAQKNRKRILIIGILVILLAVVLFYCIMISMQTQSKGALRLEVQQTRSVVEETVE